MNRKRKLGIIGVMIIVLTVFVAPTAPADSPWPIMQNIDTPGITTTPDGDVVLSECFPQAHTRDNWSQTFDATGQQIASVENTGQSSVEGCHDGSFVARNNRRITLERTIPNQSLSNVVGYEGNQKVWSYTPSTSCSSGVYGIQAKGISGNGNAAYIVISNGCGSDPMLGGTELISLSMATGVVQFQVTVPSNDLRPYLNGYVFYTYGQGFTYFNSSGAVQSSKGYSTSDVIKGWSIGANGELAILYSSSYSGCTQYLALRNSHGTAYRNLSPSSGCQYQTVHVTPTGGTVVVGYGNYMYAQDISIVDEISEVPVKKVGSATTSSASVQVDTAGNILVADETGVSIYNAHGSSLDRLELKDYFPALSTVGIEATVAFSQDVMYAIAQQYPHGPYDPNGYPTYLARVPVAGVGIDYPRGTFLGDPTTPVEPSVDYVAMGDSFSSGEGVPPFEPGTGHQGGCHRSEKSYPRLLENANEFLLGDGFVACSGASTTAITLGNNGQPAQLDKVTADTDVITMTIGGNDVPFRNFATACADPRLGPCNKKPYQVAIAGISNNVIPRMENMLNALRDRLANLNNTDATVLVIGYPQLVPDKWIYGARGCWWLQQPELPAIRNVTKSLNTAIENEVRAIGGKFRFVSALAADSPFIGHELCRARSDSAPNYFRNVDLSQPEAYTFHPNEQGQRAYADLVKSYLAQHPLN